MAIYSLDILLSQFRTSQFFHVWFELWLPDLHTGFSRRQVRWSGIPIFKNFPQFVGIHTVKSFCIVSETEVDVFLEFPCFLYDPMNVSNLISCYSAFCKSSLYIWKFSVHILLKPSLKDFEHTLANM